MTGDIFDDQNDREINK